MALWVREGRGYLEVQGYNPTVTGADKQIIATLGLALRRIEL